MASFGRGRTARAVKDSGGVIRAALTALVVGIAILVLLAGAIVLVAGRPPHDVTIAAGAQGGAYFAFAEDLRAALARRGFRLQVLETNGSVDNVAAIDDGRADIALVQSGTETVTDVAGFTALAELFYEPVWVWYRKAALPAMESLTDLEGLRVAVGAPGSGTQAVAMRLLGLLGIRDRVTAVEVGTAEAEEMLRAGTLDAAFAIVAPTAPVIERLAASDELGIYGHHHADAYSRRFPYLSEVTISRGVLDIPRDVPPANTSLLAARATLVGEPGLHPDLARLLVSLLPEVLPYPLVGDPHAFPSLTGTRFPVNEDAQRFFTEGPTPLEAILPFELASPLSRYYVLILPLAVLIFPAWTILKAVYRWYASSRIVNWYPRIHAIERHLPDASLAELEAQREFLRALGRELPQASRVPASYLAAYYDLRNSVTFVTRQVDERIAELEAVEEAGTTGHVPAGDAAIPGAVHGHADLPADAMRITDRQMGIDDELGGRPGGEHA